MIFPPLSRDFLLILSVQGWRILVGSKRLHLSMEILTKVSVTQEDHLTYITVTPIQCHTPRPTSVGTSGTAHSVRMCTGDGLTNTVIRIELGYSTSEEVVPMSRHSKSTLGAQIPRVQVTRDRRRKADPMSNI